MSVSVSKGVVMDLKEKIPSNRISAAYLAAENDTKIAVTRLLQGHSYIQAVRFLSDNNIIEPDLKVDWKADQQDSSMMIAALIHIGTQEYGAVWKRGLRKMLDSVLS